LDAFTNLLGVLVSLYIIVSATQIIRMLAANDQRSIIARVPMARRAHHFLLSFAMHLRYKRVLTASTLPRPSSARRIGIRRVGDDL
jgi:hypothetical protein